MPVLETMKLGVEGLKESLRGKRTRSRPPRDRETVRKRDEWIAAGLAVGVAVVYCAVVAHSLTWAYVDLGDGNYLYTSARMADGLRIYRDFLSPQPPLHLVTGSLLIRLGRLWQNPLMTVRVFSKMLHALTMGWIYLLGRRLTQTPYGGTAAALIYTIIPVGFWWTLEYQSEPLEVFWLLGSLWFFLPLRPRGMLAAGALMSLAALTNMTAAPYALGCLVYLAVRHPRRLFLRFAVPFAAVLACVIAYYQIRTGAYFENVIFNQVGSYPKEGFWRYAGGKLLSEGSNILHWEGGYVLLALLGLILYNRTDTRPEREFLVWYALIFVLSIVFVTKGGTMDYIFTIGEPMVALFGAYFVCQFFYPATHRRFFREPFWRDTSFAPQIVFFALVALSVGLAGARFVRMTLAEEQFEHGEDRFRRVEHFIDRYSKPGDRILAHPFYAFATGRLLAEEYSELFLWKMKYMLERQENRPGDGVRKVQRIEQQLLEGKIPIVIAADSRSYSPLTEKASLSQPGPLILFSPEIRSAIEKKYKALDHRDASFQTKSFNMRIFVPKSDEELAQGGTR